MPDLARAQGDGHQVIDARAQADEALEQAAQLIKRRQGQDRRVLQAVRQAQAVLKGVSVENTAEGGTDDGRSNEVALP